ncbi:hypothetical protein IAD21_05252 [Abditibacteriota bacterium]|nr:hypothetical protein IAD21_05252 [Abditibacteriota bacterium]
MRHSPSSIAFLQRWRPAIYLAACLCAPALLMTAWAAFHQNASLSEMLTAGSTMGVIIGSLLLPKRIAVALVFYGLGSVCALAYLILQFEHLG